MVAVRFHGRRLAMGAVLAVATLGVYHLCTVNSLQDQRDRVLLRNGLLRRVQYGDQPNASPAHLACQHPDLDVKNPEIYRFFHHIDPVECGEEPEWVTVKGSEATITQKARDDHGDIECSFTEVVRENDYVNRRGLTTTTHDSFTLVNSDFYTVACTAKDGKTWSNTIAGIRRDEDVRAAIGWDKVAPEGLKVNYIMIGFDSLSRNTFIRTLPKSYAFLSESLGAHVLEGYNIVGDGTPQQLIPILTGKTELELPETRRRMGKQAQYVNSYPFVWDDFKKNGYVTMFAEDQPHIGTFTYRLRGFDAPPTHHYMRPFFVSVYPEYKDHPKLCLRNTPRHKVGVFRSSSGRVFGPQVGVFSVLRWACFRSSDGRVFGPQVGVFRSSGGRVSGPQMGVFPVLRWACFRSSGGRVSVPQMGVFPVLRNTERTIDLEMSGPPIMEDEVRHAVRKMKKGKAPGPDN
ncbi:uncharacterized protein LOC134771266 [Penaeus indicus]|uniref:uncharacterized protein LOC134771266 n=1 Tax=Penaeus indicus TaxID=29960 RepID=UPI00300D541C